MTRVAQYLRISSDRSGEGTGVDRQRRDLDRLCAERGWTVVESFVDNDRSAFGAKDRPAWKRMLSAAARGSFDVLAAYHDDRLWRDVTEQQAVFSLLADCGVKKITTPGRDYDTSSSDDLVMSGMAALMGQKSSLDAQRRLLATMADNAMQGKFGGGFRPFGLDQRLAQTPEEQAVASKTGKILVINEPEAALLRHAARRIINGEGAQGIAEEWNAAGVTTVTGKRWTGKSLRRILQSPTCAALRIHNGEIIGDAAWPAILDRGTWEAVNQAISSRPEARVGAPPRTYLLSGGILRCSLCGKAMRARPRSDKTRSYVCVKEDTGCGGVRCVAEPCERLVVDAVFAAIDGGALERVREAEAGDDVDKREALEALRTAEEKLAGVEERYLLGDVSRAAYLSVRERLTADVASYRRVLASAASGALSADLPSGVGELRAWWDAAGTERRRLFLRLFVEAVEVLPAAHRGQRFTHERIRIVWAV